MTFAFRLLYWAIGLWLFRRRVHTGDAAAGMMLVPGKADL